MLISCYGDALFNYARYGQQVRDDLMLFKVMIKNLRTNECTIPKVCPIVVAWTDDDDVVEFE